MNGVMTLIVDENEGETRLDRWFKRRFPSLTHGRLEKLLRTGQIRIDGARAKANQRLTPGQSVRVPPLPTDATKAKRASSTMSSRDDEFIKKIVLYKDADLIALNKPTGLAVQGGSKTSRHIDGMLDGLQFGGKERPKLVHRLDRDTSGVLLIARTAKSANVLGHMFQSGDIEKTYWAIVQGRPQHPRGTIDAALAKQGGKGYEKMAWDEKEGRDAVTDYETIGQIADRFTWLKLMPRTGRTHQIRAHCALMNTPIVGDVKYGAKTDIGGGDLAGLGKQLALHARRVVVPRAKGSPLVIEAPLPDHMKRLFDALGFQTSDDTA